jgi:ribosomal protein S18 acetylase RimI-like enzyme
MVSEVVSMLVRSFQLLDYSSVTQLLAQSLGEDCLDTTMKAFGRQLAWDSELILIAEWEGTLQGVIVGTIEKGNGYFYRLAVNPSCEHPGIGVLLIDALRNRFDQRKVNQVMISMDDFNAPNVPLFEKAGYVAEQFTTAISRLSIVAG